MKDPADNRTIDMLLENYLVEVTAQVIVKKTNSPCVAKSDRKKVETQRCRVSASATQRKRSSRREP